jgi:TetR/AcrR family transcriptional regulator, cholesterol catabolism regulator
MTIRRIPQPAVRSRRPRRGTEVRRRKLADVASRLIFERGFDSISVNDLAEFVGMSVGGMYRYIKTKADLLVMACEGIYGDLRERIVATAARRSTAPEKLRAAMTLYFEACIENRNLILLTYREYRHLPADAQRRYQSREESIAAVFAELIESGIRQRIFDRVNAAIIARDIIMLGHMPALKGWSLRRHAARGRVTSEHIDLVLGRLLTTRR